MAKPRARLTREVWIVRTPHLSSIVPADVAQLDLQPLGPMDEVKAAIAGAFPKITWLDPWSAIVDGEGWMAEVNMRVGQPTPEATIRIHGRKREPEGAFDAIRHLCSQNGWRAVELGEWEFVA